MSENSDKYRKAVADLSIVVEAVPDEKWSAPSPCEGWTAQDLLEHLVGGFQRVSAVEGGDASFEPTSRMDEDPIGAYMEARDRALGALTEENLPKMVQGPMGEIPLDQQIGMFSTLDVLIHTWDLARSAGIDVKLDPGLVKQAYESLLPIDQMIRVPGVFGPKVDPPPDADPQTTLMCFTGRHP